MFTFIERGNVALIWVELWFIESKQEGDSGEVLLFGCTLDAAGAGVMVADEDEKNSRSRLNGDKSLRMIHWFFSCGGR